MKLWSFFKFLRFCMEPDHIHAVNIALVNRRALVRVAWSKRLLVPRLEPRGAASFLAMKSFMTS